MLPKILFLCCVSAVLTNGLQVTPSELKTFFQDIDTVVKNLEQQAMVLIRRNLVPLENACANAKSNILDNITDSTKYYWTEIRMLEQNAQKIGQDISQCTKVGNQKLYDLNNLTINTAYEGIGYHNHSGLRLVDSSFTQVSSVIEELTALEQVVNLCNNDTTATSLKQVITLYYDRAKNTLDDAGTRPANYVSIYLPILLKQYTLDKEMYQIKYTVFVQDVKDCISKLKL